MNTQRMTAQSKANIQAADRAELIDLRVCDEEIESFAVKLWKAERTTVVSGSYGPVTYPTIKDARRAIKRIRADLELTSFA
jgi:hypothetical protein